MADDKYTFEQARIRLEEIAAEVRKKDTSLEKSLDLLEEGVRLANICTDLVDRTDTSASITVERTEDEPHDDATEGSQHEDEAPNLQESPVEGADDAPDGFEDADDSVSEPADADVDE